MSQSTARTVVKNMGAMMASQVMTWGMSLLLTLFLPRYLGAEGSGKYYLAVSLWTIAGILANFGMDILLTKEIARKPEKTDELLGTSLLLRTLLFGVAALSMAFYLRIVAYPPETLQILAIFALTSLLSQYSACVEAVLRGLERMEFISIATVVLKSISTFGALLALVLGYGILVVVSLTVLASFIHLLLLLYFLNRVHKIRLSLDRSMAVWMLKSSYSYFFVNIFLVLYAQVDIVVISLLVNEETIGWYAVADVLCGTLLFLPTVLVVAIFPALSRMHTESADKASILLNKGFDLLLLCGVPIGLGLAIIANPLVTLFYGQEFAPSGPVLALRGIVLIFTFQNMLLGQYYISVDRTRFWTWIMVVATLATIPLDLLFVPWSARMFGNGAIGGALAYVVTELGMLVVALAYLPAKTFGWDKLWLAGRIFAAGTVMAGAAWLVHDRFIAIPVLVGAVVYLIAILALRVVSEEDWTLLKHASLRVLERIRSRRLQPAG